MPWAASLPSYPTTVPAMLWLALQQRPRSFRDDSRRIIDRLSPPLEVEGTLPDLAQGSWLVVVNHYSRPGFRAWWIPMAISSVLPRDVCWITTSALTFPDRLRASTLTPLSRLFLHRVASIYGFIPMPPMPPRPFEVEARAAAVRLALRRAAVPGALLGLAPEGADMPGGVLTPPPPGAGRFLRHLMRRGLRAIPVGVFEHQGRLCLRFGRPPDALGAMSESVDDDAIARPVMSAIAAVMPRHLRGCYG